MAVSLFLTVLHSASSFASSSSSGSSRGVCQGVGLLHEQVIISWPSKSTLRMSQGLISLAASIISSITNQSSLPGLMNICDRLAGKALVGEVEPLLHALIARGS